MVGEREKFLREVTEEMFDNEIQRKIVMLMKKRYNENLDGQTESPAVHKAMDEGETKKYLKYLSFITEIEFKDYKKEEKEKELKKFFIFLKKNYLKSQIKEIENKIKESEKKKEEGKTKILTERVNTFLKELTNLEK